MRWQGNWDLVSLADIAHIRYAALARCSAKASLRDDGCGLLGHLGQKRVHRWYIERGEPLIKAAHHLVADRRAQEADGAAHTRAGGHQHLRNAELFGDPV